MRAWILLACVGCSATPAVSTEPAPAAQPEPIAPSEAPLPAPATETATPASSPAPAELPPPLPKGTVVLHIGDSMADALGKPLNKELEKRGIKSYLEAREATYIPEWAGFKMDLGQHLARRKPDLVLITLGGNEMKIPKPSERIDAIKRLVEKVGDRPCLWIAAPVWPGLKSTGLLDVIRDNCAPCIYVDTNVLIPDLERLKDGVHPTIPERRRWAQFMIQWLLHNRDAQGPKPWSFKATTSAPPPDSIKWLDTL